jgi:hypothetical protein
MCKVLKSQNISEEVYQNIRTHLPVNDWAKGEIPYSQHPGFLWRQADQLAMVISGSITPQMMHGFPTDLAGELIAIERNPRRDKGEGDLNSYHFITISGSGDHKLPYRVQIYNFGGDLAHWPSDADLNAIVGQLMPPAGTRR